MTNDSGMSGSWQRFALLYLGTIGMFLGVVGFLTYRDTDYGYDYEGAYEQPPADAGNVTVYSVLDEGEREVFQEARERGQAKRETVEDIPAPVVRKNGTYHVSSRFEYFDWLDPRTGGTALLGVGGIGAMAVAAYRDA